MRLYIFIFLIIIFGCTQKKQNNQFTLTGKIENLDTGIAYLIVVGDAEFKDSCNISKGNFQFSKKVDNVEMALLEIKDKDYQVTKHLFIEPGNANLLSKKDEAWKAEITGTTSNSDWNDIIKLLKAIPTVVKEEITLSNANDFDKKLTEKIIQRQHIVLSDFIQQNPESYASLKSINDFYIQANKPDSVVQHLFQLISPEIRSSKLGSTIHKIIIAKELTKDGAIIKDFSLPDSADQMISLYSKNEKIILLDFWASWCAPCRAENPELKKIYNQYHKKGFEIISVSIDTDKNNWLHALQKDQLPWTNLIDTYGWKGMLPELLGIKSIPFNLLLDHEKKIIGKNLKSAELENKLYHLYNK